MGSPYRTLKVPGCKITYRAHMGPILVPIWDPLILFAGISSIACFQIMYIVLTLYVLFEIKYYLNQHLTNQMPENEFNLRLKKF